MDTGNSRGFGFVALDGEEAGMKACAAMDGADLDGRVRVLACQAASPLTAGLSVAASLSVRVSLSISPSMSVFLSWC